MFVTGKPLQPSLMFVRKTGAYLSGAPKRSSPFYGRLLPLPTNIRLGWKSLPGNKHFSFLRTLVNYGRKKFYNIGPRSQIKIHRTVIAFRFHRINQHSSPRGLYHKTFYNSNCSRVVINSSASQYQSLPSKSNICR